MSTVSGRALIAMMAALAIAACDKGAPAPKKDPPPSGQPTSGPPDGAKVVDRMVIPPSDPGAADAGAGGPSTVSTTDAGAGVGPAQTTGTITGTVKLSGAAPAMPLIDRSRDANCPQSELRAGHFITGRSGGLASAVVSLPVGATPGAGKSARAATVDQKDCEYRPLVVAITAGQKVRVKNSDPTTHNVRGAKGDENLFNELHMAQAPDKVLPIDTPAGTAVALRCDIHPWMETWVYVHDTSLVDVTSTDGRFTLEGVPPGGYDLRVWHPYLGEKQVKITVKAGETTTVDVPAFAASDYKAPAP